MILARLQLGPCAHGIPWAKASVAFELAEGEIAHCRHRKSRLPISAGARIEPMSFDV